MFKGNVMLELFSTGRATRGHLFYRMLPSTTEGMRRSTTNYWRPIHMKFLKCEYLTNELSLMTVTQHSWQYLCSSNSQAWYGRVSLDAVHCNHTLYDFTSFHEYKTG
jgi:hypothetical protein